MSESLQRLESGDLDFSNPGVRKAVRELVQSKAIASAPKAFNRLLEIADSDDERSALTAIKLLMTLGGMVLNKSQIDVRLSFDDLRRRQGDSDPLSSLFDIKNAAVDAEIEEVEIASGEVEE